MLSSSNTSTGTHNCSKFDMSPVRKKLCPSAILLPLRLTLYLPSFSSGSSDTCAHVSCLRTVNIVTSAYSKVLSANKDTRGAATPHANIHRHVRYMSKPFAVHKRSAGSTNKDNKAPFAEVLSLRPSVTTTSAIPAFIHTSAHRRQYTELFPIRDIQTPLCTQRAWCTFPYLHDTARHIKRKTSYSCSPLYHTTKTKFVHFSIKSLVPDPCAPQQHSYQRHAHCH